MSLQNEIGNGVACVIVSKSEKDFDEEMAAKAISARS